MKSVKRELEWFLVSEKKPEIPKIKHAITVLVSMLDPVYEEIRPGRGYTVTDMTWDGEHFLQLSYSMNSNCPEFIPCFDIPVSWAYMPKPAKEEDFND